SRATSSAPFRLRFAAAQPSCKSDRQFHDAFVDTPEDVGNLFIFSRLVLFRAAVAARDFANFLECPHHCGNRVHARLVRRGAACSAARVAAAPGQTAAWRPPRRASPPSRTACASGKASARWPRPAVPGAPPRPHEGRARPPIAKQASQPSRIRSFMLIVIALL